jgi:hypothetical protein
VVFLSGVLFPIILELYSVDITGKIAMQYKNTHGSRLLMRNRIESELCACTAELHCLQSGVNTEKNAKNEVYDLLTACENILYPITVCYNDYLVIKQFKSFFLPERQDSAMKPEVAPSGSYTQSQIAGIKIRTYDSVIKILNQSEAIADKYNWDVGVRNLKGSFMEGKSEAQMIRNNQ